jgi:hypothetical protein
MVAAAEPADAVEAFLTSAARRRWPEWRIGQSVRVTRDDRTRVVVGGSALLEAGSFVAGIPIAFGVLLLGSATGGGVGALVGVVVLAVGAIWSARSGLVGFAGGLLIGVVAVFLIFWALADRRPDLSSCDDRTASARSRAPVASPCRSIARFGHIGRADIVGPDACDTAHQHEWVGNGYRDRHGCVHGPGRVDGVAVRSRRGGVGRAPA